MSSPRNFVAVVLAAGQGTRMKSDLPKVLHPVAGRPMVCWPIAAARAAGAEEVVVVVGHGRDAVMKAIEARDPKVRAAVQEEQKGTGHAVQCALPALDGYEGTVVIVYGDVPLLPATAIEALVAARGGSKLALVTAKIDDPAGYGRILRDAEGRVVGIREHRDCAPEELAIDEMNPGIYAIDAAFLREGLSRLSADNDQGELYLTDLVAMAAEDGGVGDVLWDIADLNGINDRWQLAQADDAMRLRILEVLARSGVTIRDPRTTWVGGDCEVGHDATLEPGVVLRGTTVVGERSLIDVGCVLTDVKVAADAWLKPYTVAAESEIGEGAQTGPFSHLRPESRLGPETRIGNFVEMKKTKMGRGSKANHLAYLGDGIIGEGVNVGAGTIFCNYDGVQKHTTTLEDGAFIGSDSQLVAPVTVGEGAYVATGTTVTRDVPADALAVGRAKQQNKEGYASRLRARMKAAKAAKEKGGG
jgi:bifunctional UDP-N-acetylglucosamine pyrophosphorylase/glucosamine-1-phosphate N-acetyltransferase